MADILDAADPLFDGSCEGDLHILRTCPRIVGYDRDHGIGDFRKEINGKVGEGDDPEQDDPDGCHETGDRILEGTPDDVHIISTPFDHPDRGAVFDQLLPFHNHLISFGGPFKNLDILILFISGDHRPPYGLISIQDEDDFRSALHYDRISRNDKGAGFFEEDHLDPCIHTGFEQPARIGNLNLRLKGPGCGFQGAGNPCDSPLEDLPGEGFGPDLCFHPRFEERDVLFHDMSDHL